MKRLVSSALTTLLAVGLLTLPAQAAHTHQWAEEWTWDNTHHWHQCIAPDCDRTDSESDYAKHQGDWTVTLEPGERTPGMRSRTCTVCGRVQEEIIPALLPIEDGYTLDMRKGAVTLSGDEMNALMTTLHALPGVTLSDIYLQGPPGGYYIDLDRDGASEFTLTYHYIPTGPDEPLFQVGSITCTAGPAPSLTSFEDTVPAERLAERLKLGAPLFGKLTVLLPNPGDRLNDLDGHWAAEAVRQAAGEGWINGYPDGSFRPEGTVTRAEMTKMLLAATGVKPTSQTVEQMRTHAIFSVDGGYTDVPPAFSDLDRGWLTNQGWTEAAVCSGLLIPADYPKQAFLPDRPITRGEIAVLTARSLGLVQAALQAGESDISFTDQTAFSPDQAGYIREVAKTGIINGYPDGSFGADRTATRAEAVTMVAKALAEMDRGQPMKLELTFWEGENTFRTAEYPGVCVLRDDTVWAGLEELIAFIYREDRINTNWESGDGPRMLWDPWDQSWFYEWWITGFSYTAGVVPHYYNDAVYHSLGEDAAYGRFPVWMRHGQMMIPLYDRQTGQSLTQWPSEWQDGTLTLHAEWAFPNGS